MEKVDNVSMTNREKQTQPMKREIGSKYLSIKINNASNKAIRLSGLDKPGKW